MIFFKEVDLYARAVRFQAYQIKSLIIQRKIEVKVTLKWKK